MILKYLALPTVLIALGWDLFTVYNEVYALNTLIESHVSKMKHQSFVGMYVQTPYVQNPFEALYSIAESLFVVWFVCAAYTFLYIITMLTLPFNAVVRPCRFFI